MDFPNERYVRFYLRRTVSWKLLCWEAQAVLPEVLRSVDRAGVIDLEGLTPADALSLMLPRWPLEVIEAGITDMIARGIVEHRGDCLFWPRYMEAQDVSSSDKVRAKECRDKRRARIMAENVKSSRNVTPPSQNVTPASRPAVPNQPTPINIRRTILELPSRSEITKGDVAGRERENAAASSGTAPPPPIDPDFLEALGKTVHLRSLAEPRYGDYWRTLYETYDRNDLYFADEIARADLWLIANPRRQKRNLKQYLLNWIKRCYGDLEARAAAPAAQHQLQRTRRF